MTAPKATKRTGRKRGNNEGSIRQRADGRWEARISLPEGGRRSLFGRTRAEVQQKLTAAMSDVQRGMPLPEGRLTLSRFLEQWIDAVVKTRVRPSTLERYRLDVRQLSASPLGKLPLARVTSAVVQGYLNGLTEKGLSAASVHHRRAVLRSALTTAENWGLIARNPAAGKRVASPKSERHEVAPLSPEQARTLLAAFAGHPLEALVTVALATGLRQGELLGLRWSDVAFEDGTLTVRYQLQKRAGGFELVEPKSRSARRALPLSPATVEVLRAHRIRQIEQRLAAGPAWHEPVPDLVFTSLVGTPLDAPNVTHRFQRRLAEAGLARLRFHDLRHGMATLMLAHGADLMTIKDALGHSQISLTANTYTHVLPKLKRDAIDRMGAAIFGTG